MWCVLMCVDVGVTLCVGVLVVSGCHGLCGCVDVCVTLCVGVLVLSVCHALCGCVDVGVTLCVGVLVLSVTPCVGVLMWVSRSVWVCWC